MKDFNEPMREIALAANFFAFRYLVEKKAKMITPRDKALFFTKLQALVDYLMSCIDMESYNSTNGLPQAIRNDGLSMAFKEAIQDLRKAESPSDGVKELLAILDGGIIPPYEAKNFIQLTNLVREHDDQFHTRP